jgi:Coenzyme PQQ synthesis protein D (PqqD)
MKLSDDVVWRLATDDQVLLLSLKTEHYFELNSTASFLWKCLDSAPTNRNDLVGALRSEFEIDQPVAESDVDGFLEKLRSIGALEE